MRRNRNLWLTLATLAVMAESVNSRAQSDRFDCAPARPSKSLQPAYGRTDPLVCEGFYDRNVSQPFIEVMSATLQPSAALRQLDVAGFSLKPRTVPGKPMTLRVQPLPVATLYRVDARIERGKVRWSPAKMLEHTKLRLSELGFLALATPRKGTELAVVPLQVGTAPASSSTAYVTIRVSTEITRLNWRAYPTFGATGANLAWRDALDGRKLYRWSSFPLEVPLSEDGKSTTLELNAFDKMKQPLRSLQIVIAGTDYENP